MNARYLTMMEIALSAYETERIERYFQTVKTNGLTEHGFARLTANVGILNAYGRRLDLHPLFLNMMEFCCAQIPKGKAANDFSVREIVCCLYELEKSGIVPSTQLARWKGYLKEIDPKRCYDVYANTPADPVRNWALFSGVSEYFRAKMLQIDSDEFVETQIASQLKWFDENGMYKDNKGEIHQPMVYDLVPRGLFYLLLWAGYDGKYKAEIDGILQKSALFTLNMQSTTGELAFGGRSNQFLHNEAWLSLAFEYEAARYQKAGNVRLAGQFKHASLTALDSIERWFQKKPVSHIKNRYPADSQFGCEDYAYFDKYMITAASFLYAASLCADENVTPVEPENKPLIWRTSESFHKLFMRAGEYFAEFDYNADSHYDSNGLGRLHKKNAPSTICLSVPFAKKPTYGLNPQKNAAYFSLEKTGEIEKTENFSAFSVCPALLCDGAWVFGAEHANFRLEEQSVENDGCTARFSVEFPERSAVQFSCTLTENGAKISAKSQDGTPCGVCLPAFSFDGETHAQITAKNGELSVEYDGWVCRYQAEEIVPLEKTVSNRNGVYECYLATGFGKTEVTITIFQKR